MATLQRTTTIDIDIHAAEKRWTEFVTEQVGHERAQPSSGGNGGSADPGSVYFNDAGDGTTEVTIQLDPNGISDADESTLNERVDSYLQSFKRFAEKH